MQVKMLGVTRYLILPDAFKRKKIDIDGFGFINIEKKGGQVNFLNDRLHYELGNIQFNVIKESVCFYTTVNVEEEYANAFELAFTSACSVFLTALWLIKDNSISYDHDLFQSEKDYNFSQRTIIDSNSHCEYKNISFSKKELDEAIEWFYLLLKKNDSPPNQEFIKAAYSVNNGIINIDKKDTIESTNRFSRALKFVSVARKQTLLQPRITYYISALEALLSNSNVELRMQVADRGARILGKTYEEKVRINKIITIAYSFRSKYIHGALDNEKSTRKNLKFLESVEHLSEEMDEIIRRLTKLFLTELSHVPNLTNEEFSKWIDRLLYEI